MTPFTLGQRPALDGLRGLAILLVVLSHVPKFGLNGGFIGVDLFFVLSGFLITTLLLEEWRATSRISVKAFYARRALRLLPALALMLLTVVGASAVLESSEKAAGMRVSALMTFFYSANWFTVLGRFPSSDLGHTWSLSVEEQFYLVWPLLLLLMLRLNCSRRGMIGGLIAAILAINIERIVLWSTTQSWVRIYFGSDTHADGLLLGALLAMALSWELIPTAPGRIRAVHGAALVALGLLPLFLLWGWPADGWLYQGGYLVLNLLAAAVVLSLLASPWRPLQMLFESAPLCWVGRISYGVYLWHLPVFWLLGRAGWNLGNWHWAAAVALTFLVAAASFYGMERPLLRFKRRFERIRSA